MTHHSIGAGSERILIQPFKAVAVMKSKRRPRRLRTTNNKALLILCVVITSSVIVAFFSAKPTQATPKADPLPPPVVTADEDLLSIPTPLRPIAKGEVLSAVEFTTVKWPRSRLTGEYVTNLDEFRQYSTLTALPKLLPVPISALRRESAELNALVEGIPEGMRAITVKVDAEAAIEGWALPGNHVDVMVIRVSQDASIGLETKVIAENIRILSAGRSLSSDTAAGDTAPKTPSTVTLLVTQEDALKIKTAASIGKLNFSLRSTRDQQPATSIVMNQKKLLGGGGQPRKNDNFRGYATGPDGNRYVLTDESRWLRSAERPKGDALPPAQMPENTN